MSNPFRHTNDGNSSDKHYIQGQNPPPLDSRYAYFNRMNLGTITLAGIHTIMMTVFIILQFLPTLATEANQTRLIIGRMIPVAVGLLITLYDLFYVSVKIINRDLTNYGIDFIFFGLLGSFFGYFVGIYLIFKGMLVMIIALTDRAVFAWRFHKTFRQVLADFVNTFSWSLGFIILLFTNPWLQSDVDPQRFLYFYLALGVLAVDILVLRWLVNQNRFARVPLWIGITKLVFGVIACFYNFAGIMLVLEGIVIVNVAILRGPVQDTLLR
ncbi:MAG: hypothetical protein ACTSVZ_09070 [Promethearchaeota archaeon]